MFEDVNFFRMQHERAMAAAWTGRQRIVNRTVMRKRKTSSYVVREREDGTKVKVLGQPWSTARERCRRIKQMDQEIARLNQATAGEWLIGDLSNVTISSETT